MGHGPSILIQTRLSGSVIAPKGFQGATSMDPAMHRSPVIFRPLLGRCSDAMRTCRAGPACAGVLPVAHQENTRAAARPACEWHAHWPGYTPALSQGCSNPRSRFPEWEHPNAISKRNPLRQGGGDWSRRRWRRRDTHRGNTAIPDSGTENDVATGPGRAYADVVM